MPPRYFARIFLESAGFRVWFLPPHGHWLNGTVETYTGARGCNRTNALLELGIVPVGRSVVGQFAGATVQHLFTCRSFALQALVAFAAFLLLDDRAIASFIPPSGLPPGSKYEILFTTSDTTVATSSNIATYNNFVTSEAALNTALPVTHWHALVSTSSVAARLNAPSSASIPVYDTLGNLITNSGLYSGLPLSVPGTDEFGNGRTSSDFVWTGSTTSGDPASFLYAGGTGTWYTGDGRTSWTGTGWIGYGFEQSSPGPDQHSLHLYALSDPISTPEPASLTLLCASVIAFGAFRVGCRRPMAND
jgi:hypothetical protein